MNKIHHYGLLVLKGMAMGAADVVPGVSGGTVAFIIGIYQELVESIRSISPAAVKVLFQRGPKAFWEHINGSFLLTLGTGILFSIFTLAKSISFLLVNYPILVWAFFFGLIVASCHFMYKQVSAWGKTQLLFLFWGALTAYAITSAIPRQPPEAEWFVFLSGAIAICAMILPGVSGSFILLILGMYETIIKAIKDFDVVTLGLFASGCVVGLLSFSHLLSWAFRRYKDATLAILTGFLIGSLNVVWPWKYTVTYHLNRHGEEVPLVQKNVLPGEYEILNQSDPYLWSALICVFCGAALVLIVEWVSNALQEDE